MPLDWSVRNVRDHETVCFEQRPGSSKADKKVLNPVTEVLIWATIPIGLHTITEKNYETFYLRLSAIERTFGTYLHDMKGGEPRDRPITLHEVKKHIGLSTNASSLTDAQFRRNLANRVMREAQERLQNATQ